MNHTLKSGLLILIHALALNAQTPHNCGEGGGSTVVGVLRNASTKAPIPGRGVHFQDTSRVVCFVVTDSAGQFGMTGLLPGTFHFGVGDLGFIGLTPVTVTVNGSDTVQVEIELRPGGRLEACNASPPCAATLKPMRVTGLSSEEAFEFAVLRLGMAIAGRHPEKESRVIVCVPEQTSNVFAAMTRMFRNIAPARECEMSRAAQRTGARMIDNGTGQAAVKLSVDSVSRTIASRDGAVIREVTLRWIAAALAGESWTCTLRKMRDGWAPASCKLVGIS